MVVAVLAPFDASGDSPSATHGVALRLRLLGPMDAVTASGASVLPLGRKTKALLAIIALAAPAAVQRTRLARMLWSRRTKSQARASVRQELHRLCEALAPLREPVLCITRDQLALRAQRVSVDVTELLAPTRHKQLGIVPWPEGRLLDGLDGTDPAFDVWLACERGRLRNRLRALAEADLQSERRPDARIALAERLLELDRTHEAAWRALMLAYAARGERGMAVRAYERCRDALASAVHTPPSAETEQTLVEIRGRESVCGWSSSLRTLPRLGVLPLRRVGAVTPELANAITDEVTLALAHCGGFAVVASDGLSGDDSATFGPRSDADLLLYGVMQRAANHERLILRLLDVRDGYHVVWTHRFDHDGGNVFALQTDIAAVTAAELDVAVLLLEAEHATRSPAEAASPANVTHRALALMLRLEPSAFERARTLFEEALAKAPDYAPAHQWYALWHGLRVAQYWAPELQQSARAASKLAERALVLDRTNARALAIAGFVRDALAREPERAMPRFEQALLINRNLALAWALSGLARAHAGDLDEAERCLDRYKALAPFHPLAFLFDSGFVLISFLRSDYARAVTLGRRLSEIYPLGAPALVPYLAALGHLGRVDEARSILDRLLAIAPRFAIQRFLATTPLASQTECARLASGLRLAGVPAGEVTSTTC